VKCRPSRRTISWWVGRAVPPPPFERLPKMIPVISDDERWMRVALAEAQAAAEHGDVPVGAVVVGADGTELSRGRNLRERDGDPTAHAELVTVRAAAKIAGHWRLSGATLFVTLEPCAMCAGALVN